MPLGLAVEGTNRHDMKVVDATLNSIPIETPEPRPQSPQHLWLDAGYDFEAVRQPLQAWGYTAHIRSHQQETQEKAQLPGYRARRWVVERTHSWMNRFRRVLIRCEKKTENYLAFLHFSCAWVPFSAAGFFG